MKLNASRIAAIIFTGLFSIQAISQSVSLNFREADIRAVIESAAEITGRSFLRCRFKGFRRLRMVR